MSNIRNSLLLVGFSLLLATNPALTSSTGARAIVIAGSHGMDFAGASVATHAQRDKPQAQRGKSHAQQGPSSAVVELQRLSAELAGLHQPLDRVRVHAVRQALDPQIRIQPDRLVLEHGSGEWYNVTWSGVSDPLYDDWIAVVVPADANLTETAPTKWKFAAGDPQHIMTGSGSLSFRMISYRADFAFVVLRNGFDRPVEVARSHPVRVLRPNEPLQVHLALTGDPSEMRVQWNTRDAGQQPQVRWGPQSVAYDNTREADPAGPAYPFTNVATSSRYTREDMCGGAAASVGWVDAGTHHVALMSGLKLATRYFYRVGDPGGDGWSEEHSFWTAPEASPDVTVRILAIADMGQAEVDGSLEGSEMVASLNTTSRMARVAGKAADEAPYSLLLHVGDISYARGYATQWDNFMHQIEPLAARMPYMVAPGNHERDWPGSGDFFGVEDSGGECGVPFERRFPMPYPGKDKQWYGFEYGPVFFLQYSTEHPFGPGTEQYEFVVQTLQSVDRRRTPWLVVAGHRPFYVASTSANWPDGDQPVSQLLQDAFEDLFIEYGVDLTVQGHHHSYQRTCPLYRGACQGANKDGVAGAPVHMVIGNAGAGLSVNIMDPPPDWLKALALWWGYARMEVSGTKFSVEVVADDDGRLLDSLELRKPMGWGHSFMERRRQAQEARAKLQLLHQSRTQTAV